MKLRQREYKRRQPGAVEVWQAQAQAEHENWFDPSRDFDPEIKRGWLKVIKNVGIVRGSELRGVEYAVALFPKEFEMLTADPSIESGLRAKASGHVVEDLRDPRYALKPFKSAFKYLLFFPGSAEFIDIPESSKAALAQKLRTGSTRDGDFLESLFFKRLVLGDQDVAQNDWEKVIREIALMKRMVPSLFSYVKYIAKMRLLFPKQDFSQLFSEEQQKMMVDQLRELRQCRGSVDEKYREQYTEGAWWATILAAEEVQLRTGGEIFFQMPKSKMNRVSRLPARPTF